MIATVATAGGPSGTTERAERVTVGRTRASDVNGDGVGGRRAREKA